MKKILHEVQENANFNPLLDRDLIAIKDQLVKWDRAFGPGVITLWLFDTAFHQVYEAEGFEFANNLLTQMRHALKRSEGSKSLEWLRRCKKAKTQPTAEELAQQNSEAA